MNPFASTPSTPDDFNTLIQSIDDSITKSSNYYQLINNKIGQMKIPLDAINVWVTGQLKNISNCDEQIKNLQDEKHKLEADITVTNSDSMDKALELKTLNEKLEKCETDISDLETHKAELIGKVDSVTTKMTSWLDQLSKNEKLQLSNNDIEGLLSTVVAMNTEISNSPPAPPPAAPAPTPPPSPTSSPTSPTSTPITPIPPPPQFGNGKRRKRPHKTRKLNKRMSKKKNKSRKKRKHSRRLARKRTNTIKTK